MSHSTVCPFCQMVSLSPEFSPKSQTFFSPTSSSWTHLVLSAPLVVAFLDIQPLSPGHLLLLPRRHVGKMDGVSGDEAAALGWWLRVLSAAVGRVFGPQGEDGGEGQAFAWNVVQNNGPRAAQTIPHVHFHIIPRPGDAPATVSDAARPWVMFGRGQRDSLDDEEGAETARRVREEISVEVRRMEKESGAYKLKL